MSFKTMILAAAIAAGVALPGVASAQAFGHQYRDGYYGRYYGNDRQDYRGDRHDRRWEQRRRWEEKQRRREWRRHHRFADGYRDNGYRY